ncbi:hypothetical protein Dimus_036500, partial [Dionaea muscipula]
PACSVITHLLPARLSSSSFIHLLGFITCSTITIDQLGFLHLTCSAFTTDLLEPARPSLVPAQLPPRLPLYHCLLGRLIHHLAQPAAQPPKPARSSSSSSITACSADPVHRLLGGNLHHSHHLTCSTSGLLGPPPGRSACSDSLIYKYPSTSINLEDSSSTPSIGLAHSATAIARFGTAIVAFSTALPPTLTRQYDVARFSTTIIAARRLHHQRLLDSRRCLLGTAIAACSVDSPPLSAWHRYRCLLGDSTTSACSAAAAACSAITNSCLNEDEEVD